MADITVMEDCASWTVRGERSVFAGRPRIKLGDDGDARPVSGSLRRFPFRVGHTKERPGSALVSAKIVVTDDITVTAVVPTVRIGEWFAQPGAHKDIIAADKTDQGITGCSGEDGRMFICSTLGETTGKMVIVVVGIKVNADDELPDMVTADGPAAAFLGGGQYGHRQSG